ncbi:MAG: hypothetical protein FWD59_10630, partial [Micrococcales bacterium]|nr:hypothetical protein [Micrococcales bacterium]
MTRPSGEPATVPWPAWRRDNPGDLARYVAPVNVRSLVRRRADGTPGGLPGPGGAPSPIALTKACFETLRQVGIRYADEPFASKKVQLIATPWEVLQGLRRGNCLDLALVFAGACLDAQLHPLVAVVRQGASSHAVVLIDLDPRPDEGMPTVWEACAEGDVGATPGPPTWLDGQILASPDSPVARYLPLDVAQLAEKMDDDGTDGPVSFEAAVERGFEYLAGGTWGFEFVVDIGVGYQPEDAWESGEAPGALPFTEPYLLSGSSRFAGMPEGSALRLLDPRCDVVRFAERPEYHRAWEYITDGDAQPGVHLVVVSGVGGSGKTRMAAQIAHELRGLGWVTGFMKQRVDSRADQREWLATTTAPLLLVVDYPETQQQLLRGPSGERLGGGEGQGQNEVDWRPLGAILADRPEGTQTFVMLTTRRNVQAQEGADRQRWAETRAHFGARAGDKFIAIPPRMEQPRRLYRRAIEGFAKALGSDGKPASYDPTGKSPLETLLLAWAALQPGASLEQPTTQELFNLV